MENGNDKSSAYRPYIFFLCTIVSLAIAYYFGIALPNHHKEILELEKQKFQAVQDEKKHKIDADAQAVKSSQAKEERFNECADAAEATY